MAINNEIIDMKKLIVLYFNILDFIRQCQTWKLRVNIEVEFVCLDYIMEYYSFRSMINVVIFIKNC